MRKIRREQMWSKSRNNQIQKRNHHHVAEVAQNPHIHRLIVAIDINTVRVKVRIVRAPVHTKSRHRLHHTPVRTAVETNQNTLTRIDQRRKKAK